ncbi:MAG: polysaccharide deacetylase family protein [Gammaproteobacteria bacterium]|nr:polysaccharide deacetylase family protein [Gammaproteobacteria bacterium]
MKIRPLTGFRAPPWARAGLALLLALCCAGATAGVPATAVVFMYHRFGETSYPATSVRLEQFDQHLEHLAAAGYRVWPLQRIVDRLRDGGEIPDRTVAITVDDAYLSVYTEAWPRLKKRGWPFTVFVSTDAIDRKLPAYMSWAQMREMSRAGVVFANHSARHDYLVRRNAGEDAAAWRARVRADIELAQRRLSDELGAAPMLFAYPYGEYDAALAELVRGLGFTAFGQQSGALGRGSDPRALPRFPMAEAFADSAGFRGKAAALALPVRTVEPWDPVVDGPTPPRMRIAVSRAPADGDARLDALRCFDQGGKDITVKREGQGRRRRGVRRPRRGRTAPGAQPLQLHRALSLGAGAVLLVQPSMAASAIVRLRDAVRRSSLRRSAARTARRWLARMIDWISPM